MEASVGMTVEINSQFMRMDTWLSKITQQNLTTQQDIDLSSSATYGNRAD